MSADDIDTERDADEDEDQVDDDEPIEDLEPTADDIAEGGVTPEPGLGEVESIQDLLEKQETQEAAATAEEEDEATPVVASKPGRGARGRRVPRGAHPVDRVHLQQLLPREAPQPTGGQEEDALPRLRVSDLRPGLGLRLLVCAAAGFVLSLAFPPAGIWPLAFVAVAPFIASLGGVRPRQGALLGLAFGITFFGATLYWILLFGELGFVSLVLLSASAVVVVGALSPLVDRRGWPITVRPRRRGALDGPRVDPRAVSRSEASPGGASASPRSTTRSCCVWRR